MVLAVIPSGLNSSVWIADSQVERCASPSTSPTAVSIALEHWNDSPKSTPGFAEAAARTESRRESTSGSAARPAFARSPTRCESMSRIVVSSSASGSAR